MQRTALLTRGCSCALAVIAGLHALWGCGSSWPTADRERLADAVAGTDDMPPPAACFAVAAALTAAAALVAGAGGAGRPVQLSRAAVATALLVRGGVGVAGLTRRLTPWTPSPAFQQLDRRRYGPLCLVLGAGAAASLGVARRAVP